MKKNNKNKKSSFRLTNQISDMLEEAAESLNMSKSEVIAVAIFNFWENDKNFIACPGCGKKRWVREKVPIPQGELMEFNCHCGTKFWWDDEKGRVVKVKNVKP